MASPKSLVMEPAFDVDKLSYEIFSILESKFLFGYDDPKLFLSAGSLPNTPPKTPARSAAAASGGRVRVLSIDGGGRAADSLIAAAALVRLECSLRMRSGDPASRIADFFDVAAGSGAGGVLAAMLFARGPQGRPLFSAEEAMAFLAGNIHRKRWSGGRRWLFRRSGGVYHKVFGEMTLRDMLKPVLIPCYDLSTRGLFLFSRADAVESEGFDFLMREVCTATCAGGEEAVEMRSVDGKRRIAAVGGGVALGNPTAAAITHVLNNKHEFPLAAGVEDLLVVSIGAGEAVHGVSHGSTPSAAEIARIAAEGAADMVDQAVAMAFGHNRTSNYLRIQGNLSVFGGRNLWKEDKKKVVKVAEEMLLQRNVESILFRGKKLAEQTNGEKLEWFAHELMTEHERRKTSPLPMVIIKHAMTPRLSSATTSTVTTTVTSSTTVTTSPSPSHSALACRVLTAML
ncbi:patatin-like protein 3 [Typha angustifolia]|uniref:patatin-like protein 3 n=1 Tax=Typha angustifolia TaxID=59011 RepID=UPI003C2FB3F5